MAQESKVKCGRCKKEIKESDAEFYWWCMGYLCGDCFEKFGHCGHDEANKLNESANWKHYEDIAMNIIKRATGFSVVENTGYTRVATQALVEEIARAMAKEAALSES